MGQLLKLRDGSLEKACGVLVRRSVFLRLTTYGGSCFPFEHADTDLLRGLVSSTGVVGSTRLLFGLAETHTLGVRIVH